MQRRRVLLAFGIAWLSAFILSWAVYRRSSTPPARDSVQVVAAAVDLPLGSRIQPESVRLVTLERRDMPKGAFLQASDVMDRAVSVPVAANEVVLGSKLAGKGSGEGLVALIEPGMRAVSVQVNEVASVAGFVQPGSRVDVLFTRVFPGGEAATATILHNVKVIAYGRQLDPAARPDPREAAARTTVATLLVSQEQAQRLVLAEQRGRIQLALRNRLDDAIDRLSPPARSGDLGVAEPSRAGGGPGGPPPAAAATRMPQQPVPAARRPAEERRPYVVRTYRGDKVTEVTFE